MTQWQRSGLLSRELQVRILPEALVVDVAALYWGWLAELVKAPVSKTGGDGESRPWGFESLTIRLPM